MAFVVLTGYFRAEPVFYLIGIALDRLGDERPPEIALRRTGRCRSADLPQAEDPTDGVSGIRTVEIDRG